MEKTDDKIDIAATSTGLFLPLDVLAELRLEGFVHTFPDVSLEALTAHIEANYDWALGLPRVQQKMVELLTAASGQFPA